MRLSGVRRVLADLAQGVVEALLDLPGVDLGSVLGVQPQQDAALSGFDVQCLELPILGSRAASVSLLAVVERSEQLGLLPGLDAVDFDRHAVSHLVDSILSHTAPFPGWCGAHNGLPPAFGF